MAQIFVTVPVPLPESEWNGTPSLLPPSPPPPSTPPLFPTTVGAAGAGGQIVLATESSEPQLFNGMALPFGGTVLSTFGAKRDEDVIKTSIEMILFTRGNERVMLPEFGSDMQSMLFEPNDDFLAVMLRAATEEALATWEPRAEIGPVEIEPSETVVTIRIPVIILKPDGPREVNFNIELERETLYNIPFPR